jgi:gas vesicle protein
MAGFIAGTVLGAGLGMLFAPKAGSELRHKLSEQAGTLANTASDGYRHASQTAATWAEKGREAGREVREAGREVYDRAREAVSRGSDEAERYVREAADTAGQAAGTVASRTPRLADAEAGRKS